RLDDPGGDRAADPGDEDDREDGPAVAADELARAGERGSHGATLDHDDGHDEAPPGQEDQPGDDEEEQPDRDHDGGDDPGDDQRPEVRPNPLEHLGDRRVDPPVAHVVDRVDERAL